MDPRIYAYNRMHEQNNKINVCIKRGLHTGLDTLYSDKAEYVYAANVNKIFLSYKEHRQEILFYEDIDRVLLSNYGDKMYYKDIITFSKSLPDSCLDGEIFVCLDTKELYIGNNGAPKLVLKSKFEVAK